jgi:hypothetical protein
MGTDPQQLFGVGMGLDAAAEARGRDTFVLERMHPDGHRWIAVRRFPTKADAERALAELEARGEDPLRYRVRRVR